MSANVTEMSLDQVRRLLKNEPIDPKVLDGLDKLLTL
jgi:hypothetical protein